MRKGTTLVNGIVVMLPRICRECGVELLPDGSNFSTRIISGKRYYRFLCRPCFNKYTSVVRTQANTEKFKAYRKRQELIVKKSNKRCRLRGDTLFNDLSQSDKKKGRSNDLDKDFVKLLIEQDCVYCGATKDQVRIGLDRIDNSLGHFKSNVVPCCSRCNLTRGNMPYDAWLLVAPGMKEAFKQNLFGDWFPGNKFREI